MWQAVPARAPATDLSPTLGRRVSTSRSRHGGRGSAAKHRRARLAKPTAIAVCVTVVGGGAVVVDRAVGPGLSYAIVGGRHTPARQPLAEADPASTAPSDLSPSPTPSPASRSETRPLIVTAAPSPATSSPASSPAAVASPQQRSRGSYADQVVALVNQRRAAAGCRALRVDSRLSSAAVSHSADMAERDYFAHDTPEGVTFVDRDRSAGYPQPGGENIAEGQRGPGEVMTAWMNSPGHRANILNCRFRAIGVGVFRGDAGLYWTQDFGYS